MQKFQLVKPSTKLSIPSMGKSLEMKTKIDPVQCDLSQLKIFVIHYKKLTTRKNHIISQFKNHNITNYEFIEIDRDELHDRDTSMFDENWNKGQIAIALSHFHAYAQISSGFDNGLIFEDDVILCNNFTNIFNSYMKELPMDYDMLFIGNGCDFHIPRHETVPNQHIYHKRDGGTRCSDSYLISKKCARNLCDYIENCARDIKTPIDLLLNDIISRNRFKVYWAEPTIVAQGTQVGLFKSSLSDYYSKTRPVNKNKIRTLFF